MQIQAIRHATMLVDIQSRKILIDPMLCGKGEMAPVKTLLDNRRNPLVDLPFGQNHLEKLLNTLDMLLVTHMHRDHFDGKAAELIPKHIPVLCQPGDEKKLAALGFANVAAIDESLVLDGLKISRTGGQHGEGKTAEKMGKVSGFVLEAPGEPKLYVAGDTIWCKSVEEALSFHKPQIIVLYSGAARLILGKPITMKAEDIKKVCLRARDSRVIAVHMEAFNHCRLTRSRLKNYLQKQNLLSQVLIPNDGDWIDLG